MYAYALLIVLALFDAPVGATKIPSNVLDLNDRFVEVMDKGFWFVKVRSGLNGGFP